MPIRLRLLRRRSFRRLGFFWSRRLGLFRRGSGVARPGVAGALDLEPDDRRADGEHVARLAAKPFDLALDGRGDLDGRLVGHHGGQHLVLADIGAFLHHPLDELGLGDALADIGQLDHIFAHQTVSTFVSWCDTEGLTDVS